MADITLKTDYKDDVLDTSVNTQRKYQMIQNEDGTVSFVDVTEYSQVGDSFGSADVNAIAEAYNGLNSNIENVKVYVGDDGKIHFTDRTGADSVLPFKKGICINLGNGTSFDVKTVCVNNGIDYTKLTNSNFIVGARNVPNTKTATDHMITYNYGWAQATGFTVSHSYNASTGVLSVSGTAQTVQFWDSVNNLLIQSATQTATCFAYLVYEG